MISIRSIARRAVAPALAVALAVSLGCSGSNDTTSTAPVAKFTADNPTPGPATVSIQPATVNGASVTLKVSVTDVPGFFGTAFHIVYDPDALLFTGWDYSSSFLLDGVNASDVFFLEDHLTNGGTIVAIATRLNPGSVSTIDVTGTQTLVYLNFVARKPLAVGAPEGRIDFGDPKQVCDGTVVSTECGPIAVTWSGGGLSAQ